MKEINKLVKLINSRLKSNFDVIDLSGNVSDPGKEQQLYNGVLNGEFINDEVTAENMYGADIYDQRFRMLKSRLRYKLFDLIYHLDFETPDFSFKTQKKLECQEYLHKAKILFELGELDMSEKLFNKVLVIGNECQFTCELVEAMELRRKMLSALHKPTDFDQTVKDLQDLRNKKRKEEEAEDNFLRAQLLLSKSIHSRNTSLPVILQIISELDKLYESTHAFSIFEFIYQLKISKYFLEKDFTGLVSYLDKAAIEVRNMSINQELFDYNQNSLLKAKALLFLEEYSNGLEVIKSDYTDIDKTTNSWYLKAELNFLLALHDKNYAEAHLILKNVWKNTGFSKVSTEITSRWKLFKLYLNFAAPELEIQKRIRFTDIHIAKRSYFKEQKGYIISLLVIEFLHALKDSFKTAEAKMDSIDQFYSEKLSDPGKYSREKQFYKLLVTLRKCNYNVSETIPRVESYLTKMSEKKSHNPFGDFEIIPLEHLWEMVCKAVTVEVKI
ncbi:hypothetical protein [Reichenbachiella versicolor]|uniref:hypothetical protein n=1 Tax=Reichenbachiella versicolor TaxID=1821036 RepID=UPI000D6E5B4F|nr:hypothetical protein [Reichenbachiella versicolor]